MNSETSSPIVSVIIPCYNQSAFLAQALKRLSQQTLHDFECLVVDDGSTDNSASIASQFAESDSRFRLFRKENGGTATARNVGLRNARGRYVQFLDADDALDESKLERQTRFMEENNLDVSYTEFRHFRQENEADESSIVLLPHRARSVRTTLSLRFTLLTRYGVDFSLPPIVFLYRREFLEAHSLRFSEAIRYREDWDWILNVSRLRPLRIASMLNYIGAYYRQNPKGKTSSANKLTEGNVMYLAYKCRELHGVEFLLWAERLSSELVLLAGRVVKHFDLSGLSLLGPLFRGGWRPLLLFLVAILLLPLAIVQVILRTIYEYSL
jgi:hypothetical protein